ncbi:MAG: hypothetical protein EA342_10445 [Leptolyngbya sp. LCM1.Bin17]|nr:MAG: hypothetical protein EA342_10445 [Leptolyngbya sp. LCM1.Bin17]
MTMTPTLRSTLVPVLRQDCLQRQEIAQLYKALAKGETCSHKRDLYRTLATQAELGLLRPARRLHRLGESVPAFRPSWGHQLKRWWLCQLNAQRAMTWLQSAEAKNARRYLEVITAVIPTKAKAQRQTAGLGDAETKQRMLLPRSPYYGQPLPQQVAFNQVLQDFASQVSLTCALETGGKISPSDAMARLDTLWQTLQMTRMRHRLAQDLPGGMADKEQGRGD